MITKDLIKSIIIDYQRREYSDVWPRNIELPVESGKIITLTGVRRSGKTFLLYDLINQLKKKGITNERILYFNFDDERLNFLPSELDLILQSYQELYPNQRLSDVYFFFDEIQEASGWEKFVNRIYSSISSNIFITGSNAKFLSQEISTSLRGRTLTFEVYPLSFSEFVKVLSPGLNPYSSTDKALLIQLFKTFVHQGGFPELIKIPEELREKTLQEYFNVMLFRDMVERYHITNVAALKYFCKRVAGNSANEFSVRKIYNELISHGFNIGREALYDFQEQIDTIYMCRFVNKFDLSVIKSENAQKKCYIIDQGLGIVLDYKFSQDLGRLFETTIALEFFKKGLNIYYHKNGADCDFVISGKSGVFSAIQVTLDLTEDKTREREIKGLVNSCLQFQLKDGYILTMDQAEELVIENTQIHIIPAWKYFYSQN